MKNCMFQYGTRHRMLVDTDLITVDEAIALFEKNRDDYIKRLNNGEDPEMCIWSECETSSHYEHTLEHWVADDMLEVDGWLYQRV